MQHRELGPTIELRYASYLLAPCIDLRLFLHVKVYQHRLWASLFLT